MPALFWAGVGLVALFVTCFVHNHSTIEVSRQKFVFNTIMTAGLIALGYVSFWVFSGQHPTFSLAPVFYFGVTMVTTALTYGLACLLCKRDIAPFK
jgi:ABC-type iron transport system FetAB permease component